MEAHRSIARSFGLGGERRVSGVSGAWCAGTKRMKDRKATQEPRAALSCPTGIFRIFRLRRLVLLLLLRCSIDTRERECWRTTHFTHTQTETNNTRWRKRCRSWVLRYSPRSRRHCRCCPHTTRRHCRRSSISRSRISRYRWCCVANLVGVRRAVH